jgi:uncharacterized RDD family membrane protein YckC
VPEISESENPYAAPTVDPILREIDPAGELDLATRWERFFGGLIDLAVLVLPLLAFSLIMVESGYFGDWYAYWVHGFEIALFMITQAWFLATRGQTIGKVVMRTRIVLLNGQSATFGRLIALRYAPFWAINWIPVAGGWIELIDLLFIFREDKRCMHDLLAGTKVVKIGRYLAEMPQPRLMPRRNPAHTMRLLSKLLLDELDLSASEIPPGSRWVEDLGLSREDFAEFRRKLEAQFITLTAYELEKCATYGDLLRLLGIPPANRPR